MGNFGEGLVGFLSQGSNAFWDQMMENRKQAMGEKELEQRRMQIEQAIAESKQNMLLTKAQLEKHKFDMSQAKREADLLNNATMQTTESTDQGPWQGQTNVQQWRASHPGYENQDELMMNIVKQRLLEKGLEPELRIPFNFGGVNADVPESQYPWAQVVGLQANRESAVDGTGGGNTPPITIPNLGTIRVIGDSVRTRVRKDLGLQLLSKLKVANPSLGRSIIALMQNTGSLEDFAAQGLIDPRWVAGVNALADRSAKEATSSLDPSYEPDIPKLLQELETTLGGTSSGVSGTPIISGGTPAQSGKMTFDDLMRGLTALKAQQSGR
jgi:hypothetical protein